MNNILIKIYGGSLNKKFDRVPNKYLIYREVNFNSAVFWFIIADTNKDLGRKYTKSCYKAITE